MPHRRLDPRFGGGTQVGSAAHVAAANGQPDAAMDRASVGPLAEPQALTPSSNRAAPAKVTARWNARPLIVDRHPSPPLPPQGVHGKLTLRRRWQGCDLHHIHSVIYTGIGMSLRGSGAALHVQHAVSVGLPRLASDGESVAMIERDGRGVVSRDGEPHARGRWMPPLGSVQQASADPLTLTRQMHIKAAEIERVLRLLARVDVTDDRPRLLGDQKGASRFFNLHAQDRNRVPGIGDFRNISGTNRGIVGRVPGFDKQTTDRRHIGHDGGRMISVRPRPPAASAVRRCLLA